MAQRILVDPYKATCPDFTDNDWAEMVASIAANKNITGPEAAEGMVTAWERSNQTKRAA